jgi:RimJ/RimL family protein N-acetyltransferase
MPDLIGAFALREMVEADLTLVWKWRNHESIRRNSVHSGPIPWSTHLNWFRHVSANYRLIFTEQGRSIGVLIVDHLNFWSFYLDPELPKGKGYGRIMLSLALAHLQRPLGAKVLKDNTASLKLHKALGFKQVENKAGVIELWRK